MYMNRVTQTTTLFCVIMHNVPWAVKYIVPLTGYENHNINKMNVQYRLIIQYIYKGMA